MQKNWQYLMWNNSAFFFLLFWVGCVRKAETRMEWITTRNVIQSERPGLLCFRQMGGAALPNNTPGTPCIFDPQGRAGICGDWLLGSSLENAALSGMFMASHIGDYFQSSGTHAEDYAIGLQNEFQQIQGHDIGNFSGLEPAELIVESR